MDKDVRVDASNGGSFFYKLMDFLQNVLYSNATNAL
jgi:hypothetical protein